MTYHRPLGRQINKIDHNQSQSIKHKSYSVNSGPAISCASRNITKCCLFKE